MGCVASLSSGARRVFCVGSANEIPLQNSSTLLDSVVPIWLCRLRRSAFVFLRTLLCLLCSALAVLCARADGFCGSADISDRCDSCAAQSVGGASERCALPPAANAHHQMRALSETRFFCARAVGCGSACVVSPSGERAAKLRCQQNPNENAPRLLLCRTPCCHY